MAKVPGLIKGLGVTFGTLVRTAKEGANTVQYPHEKETPPIRARGVIALHEGNCTSCMAWAMQASHWSRSRTPIANGMWRMRKRGWPKRSV